MKRTLVIIGMIFILVVAAGIAVFSLNVTSDNPGQEIDLRGTWFVYQFAEHKIRNEYMVFDDDSVSDYRDGKSLPFMTSTYTYEDNRLILPDVPKEFTVRIISENNIILIEPDTREWKMIRVTLNDQIVEPVTPANLAGEYDVLMLAGEKRSNEIMTFSETQLVDYRDGEEYLSCSYEMKSDHILYAIDLQTEYHIYKSGNYVLLVDIAEGYVWELHKRQ